MSNCTGEIPFSKDLLTYMATDPGSIVLVTFMSLFTALVLAMYIEALYYLNNKVKDSRTRIRLKVILGIYPIYACTSLLALFIPRAHLVTTLLATIYFSTALLQFMLLIISYFGGREQLLKKLEGHTMPVASPPILCCCVCLPPVPVNKRNLFWLRRLVMQTAYIRPLCNITSIILWADGYQPGQPSVTSPFLWLNMISLVSSVCAMLGVIILMRMTEKHLDAEYRLRPKFLLIQLVLVLTILQSVIVGAIAAAGHIPCDYPLSVGGRSNYIQDSLIVTEMVLFSFLARFFFRRRIRKTPAGRDHPDHKLNNGKTETKQQIADAKQKEAVAGVYLNNENGGTAELSKYTGNTNNNGLPGDRQRYSNESSSDPSHVNVGFDEAGSRADVNGDVDVEGANSRKEMYF